MLDPKNFSEDDEQEELEPIEDAVKDGIENADIDYDEEFDDAEVIKSFEKFLSPEEKPNSASLEEAVGSSENELTAVNRPPERTQVAAGFHTEWNVGDHCLAKYSEDGHLYEAEILSVDHQRRRCLVRYTQYGNEEEVAFKNMK
ncbi:unnamed protein product [Soboliphyme baturini]|uniref:Tudor domain-containing protein n=1 Tax=Soboliphyme baturini TaxID=241478 RepID=A0A183IUN2_9BILA|nr:unnamed protein product [Soboliphyme baturini]